LVNLDQPEKIRQTGIDLFCFAIGSQNRYLLSGIRQKGEENKVIKHERGEIAIQQLTKHAKNPIALS
jgi:hypothetical protein